MQRAIKRAIEDGYFSKEEKQEITPIGGGKYEIVIADDIYSKYGDNDKRKEEEDRKERKDR